MIRNSPAAATILVLLVTSTCRAQRSKFESKTHDLRIVHAPNTDAGEPDLSLSLFFKQHIRIMRKSMRKGGMHTHLKPVQ